LREAAQAGRFRRKSRLSAQLFPRLVWIGQAEGSSKRAISLTIETERSNGGVVCLEVAVATSRQVLIGFDILDMPKAGEI
jgi:hypothetical protein